MGIRTGLNYAGVEVIARRLNLEDDSWAFDALQLLERETLAVDHESRDQEKQANARPKGSARRR